MLMEQDGYWLLTEERVQITHLYSGLICDTTFYNAGFFDFATHSRKEKKEYKKAGHAQWDFKGDVIFSLMHPNLSPEFTDSNGVELYDFVPTDGAYMWETEQWYFLKLKMWFNSTKVTVIENSADKQILEYDALEIDRAEYGMNISSVLFTLTLERP
ncbi:MAG: hypothetical protein IPM77_04310 [Crocinitomicaceae bacterium]|nr:hypothetical protein [Crocinitomicaceae bacterium]